MVTFKARYFFNFLGVDIISELETHSLGQSFGYDVAIDLLEKFKKIFPGDENKKKFLNEFTSNNKFREKISYSIILDGDEVKDKDIATLITYPISEYFMDKV